MGLAAVAGEHLLVLGPPGTAKSEAVRRVAACLGGRYFEYLLGRFTEPSELFGPVDLRRLREGVVEVETSGMLPEAEVAFLDEVFLGSTAILNTLLGILNERRFRRGHTDIACPLRVGVGASNALPEDEGLAAFADRFLVRYFAEPVADPLLEDLLEAGWGQGATSEAEPLGFAPLDTLGKAARACDLAPARLYLAEALRLLRREGIFLSDRRAVRAQRLVAAAAVLSGRDRAEPADLWPVVFAVPEAEGQRDAREILSDVLERAESSTLPTAAALASSGPAARAAPLIEVGRKLVDFENPGRSEILKMEGVLREIDAGFAASTRPADLEALRRDLAEIVQRGWSAEEE